MLHITLRCLSTCSRNLGRSAEVYPSPMMTRSNRFVASPLTWIGTTVALPTPVAGMAALAGVAMPTSTGVIATAAAATNVAALRLHMGFSSDVAGKRRPLDRWVTAKNDHSNGRVARRRRLQT